MHISGLLCCWLIDIDHRSLSTLHTHDECAQSRSHIECNIELVELCSSTFLHIYSILATRKKNYKELSFHLGKWFDALSLSAVPIYSEKFRVVENRGREWDLCVLTCVFMWFSCAFHAHFCTPPSHVSFADFSLFWDYQWHNETRELGGVEPVKHFFFSFFDR